MYCAVCGKENADDATFCGSCGQQIPSQIAHSSSIPASGNAEMVSFNEAIVRGFKNYFVFYGRATRAEFWWWVLFVFASVIVLTIVDMVIGTYNYASRSGLLAFLFQLATLIPGLALGSRRLHDINRTGLWQLMLFASFLIVPIVVLLVWAAMKGDAGLNRYNFTIHLTPSGRIVLYRCHPAETSTSTSGRKFLALVYSDDGGETWSK